MRQTYTLYGWHLSYFTGKALCYLRYKQVDHVLNAVNLFTLTRTIKKKTGAAVMPVLKTPSGEWIQDTSEIIDYIESLHHNNPVTPNTPVQEFASMLLEVGAMNGGCQSRCTRAGITRRISPCLNMMRVKPCCHGLLVFYKTKRRNARQKCCVACCHSLG